MPDINARIASFMARFEATRDQAIGILRMLDSTTAEDARRWIATRIMQDDAYKHIGYAYMDRDPEYVSGENRNEAYLRAKDTMAADLVDEAYREVPEVRQVETDRSLLRQADAIIHKHQLWWDIWDDAREFVMDGKNKKAVASLLEIFDDSDYEEGEKMTKEEADILVRWTESWIKGGPTTLVEISMKDIVMPAYAAQEENEDEDEDDDELDEYEIGGAEYFARRGIDIDVMTPSSRNGKGGKVFEVRFKGKTLKPTQIDQVWKVVRTPVG